MIVNGIKWCSVLIILVINKIVVNGVLLMLVKYLVIVKIIKFGIKFVGI